MTAHGQHFEISIIHQSRRFGMHGVNAFGAFIRCRTTHGYLLLGICNDKSVTTQLHSRFLNFFKSCYQSDNYVVKLCSRLTAYGSRSAICDTSCIDIFRHWQTRYTLVFTYSAHSYRACGCPNHPRFDCASGLWPHPRGHRMNVIETLVTIWDGYIPLIPRDFFLM